MAKASATQIERARDCAEQVLKRLLVRCKPEKREMLKGRIAAIHSATADHAPEVQSALLAIQSIEGEQ